MGAYVRWPGSANADIIDDDAIATAMIQDSAITSAKIGAGEVETSDIDADAVTSAKIVDGGVALADHAANSQPIYITVKSDDAKTMTREENVAGLSSAIALCNSLLTVMNTHAADGGGALHVAADATNFPVAGSATDLASLLALTGLLLTAYDVHDDDSELGAAWLYHDAQEAGDQSPTSAVTPTTLVEAVTRLNDLKAKYNGHDADGTTHSSGSSGNQEATGDAAYGAANLVVDADVLSGDVIDWAIIDDGSGSVAGVTAVAGAGVITFTFSADPQNDAILSYSVKRVAT